MNRPKKYIVKYKKIALLNNVNTATKTKHPKSNMKSFTPPDSKRKGNADHVLRDLGRKPHTPIGSPSRRNFDD